MTVTLKAPVAAELEIKKSRFLAWVEPVADREQARERIEAYRAAYPDARHVCFAFMAGNDSGMSDDGEPSGTAGKPMFGVLNHKNLVDVVAVVVRYFGGVKLGAGGLVRAYSGAVSKALESADWCPVETRHPVSLRFDFALESDVRRLLDAHRLPLERVEYDQAVTVETRVPDSQLADFKAGFLDLAPGSDRVRFQAPDTESAR